MPLWNGGQKNAVRGQTSTPCVSECLPPSTDVLCPTCRAPPGAEVRARDGGGALGKGTLCCCLLPRGWYPFLFPFHLGTSMNCGTEGRRGGRHLSVALSHAQEPGLGVDLGDLERSHPRLGLCSPPPASGPNRPRPPPSGSRVNTGSGEVEEQRPDQPVSRPRLPGHPSPRRVLPLGPRSPYPRPHRVGLAPRPRGRFSGWD